MSVLHGRAARACSSLLQSEGALYAYTHRWIRPRNELLGVDDELLQRQSPVRRQLLGAGTGAIGYWIPTKEDIPLDPRLTGC